VALVLALATAAPAQAERADRLQQLNIDAGSALTDLQKQSIVYTGNVVISRGTMVIRAERVEVRQLPSGYYTAVAFGAANRAATFRQKRDGVNEYFEGEAERLEYDGKADLVKFVNRAQLRQLRGATLASDTSGDLIVYDATTEKITVSGNSAKPTPANPGGRIRSVLMPREGSEAAAEMADAASAAASAPLKLSPTLGARDRSCHATPVQGQPLSVPAANAEQATGVAHRLEATGLRKAYGARTVVKDVHLSVDSGEVVGLLGPNGAGKTTSFYMIVGLVRCDAGEITIEGKRAELLPIHQRSRLGLSYLPQEASIFRKLTVEENVRAVLELQIDAHGKALKPAEIEELLDGLLRDLSIDKLRASPAPSLSGGERRRVEIARALATQPRFILLDEPFAGVDPIAVIEIQRIISFLKNRGIGVLITDHNVRETLGICDRAYIISEGRVLAEGTPTEIVDNADVRKVYLGENFRM